MNNLAFDGKILNTLTAHRRDIKDLKILGRCIRVLIDGDRKSNLPFCFGFLKFAGEHLKVTEARQLGDLLDCHRTKI